MEKRLQEDSAKKANQDLVGDGVHEIPGHLTGGPPHLMGGYVNTDYYPGAGGRPPKPPGYDQMMQGMFTAPHPRYMGYGQLNTIEEEKHET
jgi:hypothetical protein